MDGHRLGKANGVRHRCAIVVGQASLGDRAGGCRIVESGFEPSGETGDTNAKVTHVFTADRVSTFDVTGSLQVL